jgi:glutamyl-tRNA synthetase
MTLLNSNYEEWHAQNADKPYTEFPFNIKKMSVSGCLFDFGKLNDVSKNIISRMTAEEVYEKVLAWAKSFDTEFATELESYADFAKKILAIGRGGKKPRKDIATWVDVKPYMGFFYDKYFEMIDAYTEGFDKEDIKKTLVSFLETYDANDEMNVWFDKIKKIAEDLGFASDMKAYKANPEAFKGNVADISSFIRVAVTGKQNAPDLYTVMQILGEEKTRARIENAINAL